MLDGFFQGLDQQIYDFTQLFPPLTFFASTWNVKGLLATLLVCLICGAMGALVVGNRMAFFSDALAHCAFAGIGLGLFLALVLQLNLEMARLPLTVFMVCFGIVIGILIAFVRDKTDLTSDTVIGVFYAGAIGIGAIFTRIVVQRNRKNFDVESFIFGNPLTVQSWEIIVLFLLALVIALVLLRTYNGLVLSSASPSLAHSRRIPVRRYQYLLIILLGVLVNLSLQIVGTLLINGLLIVPAAAAANVARNLRQMFWYSIALAVAGGCGGFVLSWEIGTRFELEVGISGTIVVLCVVFFVLAAVVGAFARRSARSRPTKQVA
jgi:zinc transport system permease protein